MVEAVVFADEAGSSVPGNPDHSIFLGASVLAPDAETFANAESDLRRLWLTGALRQGAEGRKATDEELDRFVEWLRKNGLYPAVCFVRHHHRRFSQRFRYKISDLNRLAHWNLITTGENREYFPERGLNINQAMWYYAVPMSVGIAALLAWNRGRHFDGARVLFDRWAMPDQCQINMERRTREAVRKVILSPRMSLVGCQTTVASALELNSIPVEVQFESRGVGRYLADYLASVALRGLNFFNRPRYRPDRLERLASLYGVAIHMDITDIALGPLPLLRSRGQVISMP